ncbi:MAG: PEP-CTERM sorting domain-containing protein [Cyanobacteria bacterium J06641_2]
MKLQKLLIASAAVLLPFVAAAPAKAAFTLNYNSSDFETGIGETSIADDGTSAATFDPVPTTDASGQASVTRTAASGLTYTIYDVNFTNNSPLTGLTPGSSGGDIDNISTLLVEADTDNDPVNGTAGVGQGGSNQPYWGVDSSGATNSNSTRNAMLVAFSSPVSSFGASMIDFESSSAFRNAEIVAYLGDNTAPVFQGNVNYPSGDGDGATNFIGLVGDAGETFDRIAFVLGDDTNGNGFTEAWAAGQFRFAQSDAVPEPFTILGSIAAIGFGVKLRKKLRGAEAAE